MISMENSSLTKDVSSLLKYLHYYMEFFAISVIVELGLGQGL